MCFGRLGREIAPCGGCRRVPLRHGLGVEGAQGAAGDQVALKVECALCRGMHRDETPDRFGRLEPPHLPLASSDRLVRDLGPVVPAPPPLVARRQSNGRERRTMGGQPVGRDGCRIEPPPLGQLAHGPEGGAPVPPAPPQHASTSPSSWTARHIRYCSPGGPDRGFVEMPARAGPGAEPAQVAGDGWPKLRTQQRTVS